MKYYPDVIVTESTVRVHVTKVVKVGKGLYETEHGNVFKFQKVYDTEQEARAAGVMKLFRMSAAIRAYLKGEQ